MKYCTTIGRKTQCVNQKIFLFSVGKSVKLVLRQFTIPQYFIFDMPPPLPPSLWKACRRGAWGVPCRRRANLCYNSPLCNMGGYFHISPCRRETIFPKLIHLPHPTFISSSFAPTLPDFVFFISTEIVKMLATEIIVRSRNSA